MPRRPVQAAQQLDLTVQDDAGPIPRGRFMKQPGVRRINLLFAFGKKGLEILLAHT